MESTKDVSLERPLRLLTYLTTAVAIPFSIAATVLSVEHSRSDWRNHRDATAFCFVFIPLAMTVVTSSLSLLYLKKHGKSPSALHIKVLDSVSAATYFAVLVPCWVVEIELFNAGGFGLLAGYTTAPMIINMLIHLYFMLKDVPYKKFLSKFHLTIGKGASSCQQCPNCQAKFVSGTSTTTTKKGYNLLRGEEYLDVEADPILYRDSEDFLGEGAERAEQPQQAKQPEDGGESKDMMDV